MAQSMVRDRLFRRFVVATLFAAAFVWVAVDSFRVPTEAVWRYLLLSGALILAMIVSALIVALAMRFLTRRPRKP